MSCVVSPAKPAAYSFFALLLGTLVVVGFAARAAHAEDVDAAPLHPWCIEHSNLPPDCAHDDPFTCGIAAFLSGGACIKAEPSLIPATTVTAAPVRQKRTMTRRKLPAAEHDKLFREFVRWKRDAAN